MPAPTYFTLVTTEGQDLLATALAAGQTVPITQMAIGDGGGAAVVPNPAMAALVNQVYSAAPSSIEVDPNNPNWLRIEMVVPMGSGGWTVREVGLFTQAGQLFAIGNFPDTYKPILTDGSARELTIVFVVQVANAAAVTLNIDPSITFATEANLLTETAARQAGDTTNAAAIAAEATTRQNADTAEAAARQGAITAEATTRQNADTAEATARQAADTTNANAIAAEAVTRQNADTAEAAARAAADTTNANAIAAEAVTRQNADTAEAATRAAADTTNATAISALAATASLARIYFMGRS